MRKWFGIIPDINAILCWYLLYYLLIIGGLNKKKSFYPPPLKKTGALIGPRTLLRHRVSVPVTRSVRQICGGSCAKKKKKRGRNLTLVFCFSVFLFNSILERRWNTLLPLFCVNPESRYFMRWAPPCLWCQFLASSWLRFAAFAFILLAGGCLALLALLACRRLIKKQTTKFEACRVFF